MNPKPPRRGLKDYFLPFLIITALAVVVALTIRVWNFENENSTSSPLSRSGSAELGSIIGGVEVYLPAVGAWQITNENVTLNSGEKVRSGSESSAELSFNDGTTLTLAANSEIELLNLQNSLSKKSVELVFVRGAIGVVTGQESFFTISANFLKIDNPVGEFIFSINEDKNTASAISGEFTAVVLDPQDSKSSGLQNFVVETGEMIEISERRINLLRVGGEIDIVKATSDEIKNSAIYLAMTGGVLAGDSENESSGSLADDSITTDEERSQLTAPFVITGGGNVSAVVEPVKITGRVAPEIVKVEVTFENDDPFLLSQFEPGSGEWNYNASRDWENLKVGINNYSVVGFDEIGNKTPIANFQINFNPKGVDDSVFSDEENLEATDSEIQSTDGVPVIGEATFAAPIVTEPNDGEIFTTAPVHFEGTVPVGTKEILVNEYSLSKFEPGSTSWYYNASPDWENLKEGENEFEIEAVSESGDRSSVIIKVIYSPEE